MGGSVLGCVLAYAGIDKLVAPSLRAPCRRMDITLNGPVLASAFWQGRVWAVFGMCWRCTGAPGSGRRPEGAGRDRRRRGGLRRARRRRNRAVARPGPERRTPDADLHLAHARRRRPRAGQGSRCARRVSARPVPRRQSTNIASIASLSDRIGALPGMQAVAATTALPPFDAGVDVAVDLVGVSTARDSRAGVQLVTSDYFRTLGIPSLRGAPLPPRHPKNCHGLLSSTRHSYKGCKVRVKIRYLVGRRLALEPLSGVSDPSRHGVFEIVGVVGDVRNQGLQQTLSNRMCTCPGRGSSPGYPLLLVSSRIEPANAIGMIRRELALIDRQVAAAQPRTLADVLDRSDDAQPRFSLLVLGLFAISGTLLVALGVFSVMAYTVSRQRKEIAVRHRAPRARRAHPSHRPAPGRAVAGSGNGVGVALSFATNRLLTTQLWNVSPHDPLTLVAASLLVSFVALTACYIPARRAMRVEPSAALREE